MQKQIIINKIIQCAKLYKENLANRNIMFIYRENELIKNIETKFLKANFMHLTGVIAKNENANSFYYKCINKRLKYNDIEIRKDGNTIKKIQVLERNVLINKNARIIGEFNKSNMYLYSEKIIGSTYSCLGFIKNQNYFVPNTSLKGDIREITQKNSKIICILSKEIQEKVYNKITYLNKNYKTEIESYIKEKIYCKTLNKV